MTVDTFPDLHELLAPVGAERFFASYWQRRMLATCMGQGAFERVLEAIGTLDITRLCNLARRGVQAWVANKQIAHTVLPVDASSAEKALAIGATLYFIDVPLEEVKYRLARFLGTRSEKILVSFFLTPPDGGAAWHFDANDNFTIQLSGAKRWFIGNAPAVDAAPDGYVAGSRLPASLKDLAANTEPEATHIVDLQLGGFLYVPRGTFHRTETHEASWSLNLSYGRAAWVDLVCDGLKQRLATSARWRGNVIGVGDACDPSVGVANILPDLIHDLRMMLDDPGEVERLCQGFLDNGEAV